MSDALPITAQSGAPSASQLIVLSDGKAISLDTLAAAVRGTIQVGGRNLAKGTSADPVTFTGSKSYNLSEPLVPGETVVFSFDLEFVDGSLPNREAYMANQISGDGKYRNSLVKAAIKEGHNVHVVAITHDANKVAFYAGANNAAVSRVKVERGNVGTDWSPAPEDIASADWGGVNQRITITYDLPQLLGKKGGRHERSNYAGRHPESSAVGIVGFRFFDALVRFIGRDLENGYSRSDNEKGSYPEYRRNDGDGDLLNQPEHHLGRSSAVRQLERRFNDNYVRGGRVSSDNSDTTEQNCHKVFQSVFGLEELEGNFGVARKEVSVI